MTSIKAVAYKYVQVICSAGWLDRFFKAYFRQIVSHWLIDQQKAVQKRLVSEDERANTLNVK